MNCPKCKAQIGLHRYESRTQNHVAQGMSCSVCGYWREGFMKAASSLKSRKKAKVRKS